MDNSDQTQVPIEGPPEEHIDGSADMTGSSTQRVVMSVGRDLAAECAKVLEVMTSQNNPAFIFSTANASSAVEILRSEVTPLTRDRVAVLAAEYCAFHTQLKGGRLKPTYPPSPLIGAVAASIPLHLPILRGIKHSPFFYKGCLVGHESGYHEDSGYYSRVSRRFDTSLKPEDCVDRLDDLLGEYPYESPADRANTFGMLVGQILKAEWVSPILCVDKPSPQTGATKICQTIAALADGLPIATLTQGKSAEETDKRIITKLLTMPASIMIDNLSASFASDIVASGLTSWALRISSGVGEGIYKPVVQGDWEFLRIGVDCGQ